jgi:hypothetical protein
MIVWDCVECQLGSARTSETNPEVDNTETDRDDIQRSLAASFRDAAQF